MVYLGISNIIKITKYFPKLEKIWKLKTTLHCPPQLHADRVSVILFAACSPARRKAKSTQHILTKRVVAVSDYRPYRTEDLLPSQGDLTQVLYKDAVRNFGRLQNEQEGFCPAKQLGISEQESSKSCDNQSDGKSSQPSTSPVTHITVKRAAATEPATQDSASAEDHRWHSRKNPEHDLTLAPEADASLPLTGNNLCGTPGILRKMWMKHKKKSEYLGATNSAFEAD
ncbi:zona pellucida-binding protein 2 [Platysternon megacephalum]|uniref:Vexin n=1 Tax=Platysternon megacephalum TaxID=55544 RepID=A0A4D9EWF0_9SAUR|nr:zona pellucida-binding protein 2 [Platysternon megacephalum]